MRQQWEKIFTKHCRPIYTHTHTHYITNNKMQIVTFFARSNVFRKIFSKKKVLFSDDKLFAGSKQNDHFNLINCKIERTTSPHLGILYIINRRIGRRFMLKKMFHTQSDETN